MIEIKKYFKEKAKRRIFYLNKGIALIGGAVCDKSESGVIQIRFIKSTKIKTNLFFQIINLLIVICIFNISGCVSESNNTNNTNNVAISDNNKIIAVTGIKVSEKKINLEVGTSTKIAFTIEPEQATDKTITWKSTNMESATVTNGIVTAVSNGNSSIILATNDGKISEIVNIFTSTSTISAIALFADKTQIKSNNIDVVTLSAKAYDQFGREIKGIPFDYFFNNTQVKSNVFSTTTSGIYKLTAKYNNIESNEISISAIEKSIIYESEPNDSFETATKIEYDADCYGVSKSYSSGGYSQSDADCYQFTANVSKTRILFYSNESYPKTFEYEIYHKKTVALLINREYIGTSDASFTDTLIGEDYIIRVKDGSVGGKYYFKITIL